MDNYAIIMIKLFNRLIALFQIHFIIYEATKRSGPPVFIDFISCLLHS